MNEENEVEKDFFKIVLYGDNYVGTTSLLRRYIRNDFDPNYYSYSNYFEEKSKILQDGKKVILQIWDIYNYYRYESLNRIYFRGADGFMLTYDITKRETFENLRERLWTVKENTGEKIVIAIIACKSDLFMEETVNPEEVRRFSQENDLLFYETSAQENYNVEECFNGLIDKIISNYQISDNKNNVNLRKKRPGKRGCLK